MIPIDSEFSILYILYIALFLFLVSGLIYSKKKKTFNSNLIFFSIYTGILIYIFSDKDNFIEGKSLIVIFLGGSFLVLHLIIYFLAWVYKKTLSKN
ncbi:membrane hypothetical protein [Tenacibaculum aestuarii]